MNSLVLLAAVLTGAEAPAAHPLAAPGVTSLTNQSVQYRVPKEHHVVLKRGDVRAVIVDNQAVDVPALRGHRAGYSGVASLSHANRNGNLFVPQYAGLNYEHIHDGTLTVAKEKFEPRRFPIELRIVDQHTVELYQAPTPNWKLESCGRYRLLADGTLEYTYECIPRARLFKKNYVALFWASYINKPDDRAIYFQGREVHSNSPPRWIKGVTPRHGVDSTHPPSGPLPPLNMDPNFPLTLVNHRSKYVYTKPWYYGVSHGMAYVPMFRSRDRIWFAQSPTGGGPQNPAWDFQWFIPNYRVDEAYGFVMRTAYIPFKNREQIVNATREHREALNGK